MDLKEAEAFYTLLRKRGLMDEYFDRFNYEIYGGTPVLGVNGNVLIGHGISSPKAIKNMIHLGIDLAEADLPNKIKNAFNKLSKEYEKAINEINNKNIRNSLSQLLKTIKND